MSNFSITAVFGVDARGVRAEMKSLRGEINSFASGIAGKLAGLGVTAALTAMAKGALDLASRLKDLSMQLGINVESLQALHYAAEQNGSSIDEMDKSLEKLRLNVQAAAEGNDAYTDALKKLGLTVSDLTKLPLEQKYEKVAQAYAKSTDKAVAYNAVAELFGTKIGPQMIETLQALATNGFAATADSARKAGHLMATETIVGLDRANQAIDDFKKRATVAVGNILINFRSEEGLRLLWLQLSKVVVTFGTRIIDAFIEAGSAAKAILGAELSWVANLFRDKFLDGIAAAARVLNRILPDGLRIEISGIDALKSAGKDLGDTIIDAIAKTSPSTFTRNVAKAYDDLIADQQKIVDAINKVDLGKDVAAIKTGFASAGDSLAKGGAKAAKSLEDAADKIVRATNGVSAASMPLAEAGRLIYDAAGRFVAVAKTVGEAFAPLWGIEGVGTSRKLFGDLSNEALEEIIRQNRSKARGLQWDAKTSSFAGSQNVGLNAEAGRLEAEALNALQELQIRRKFDRDLALHGAEGARRLYDPLVFESLLRQRGSRVGDLQPLNLGLVDFDYAQTSAARGTQPAAGSTTEKRPWSYNEDEKQTNLLRDILESQRSMTVTQERTNSALMAGLHGIAQRTRG